MRPTTYTATSRALYRVFICPSLPSKSTGPTANILARPTARRSIYKYAKPVKATPAADRLADPDHPVDEAIASPYIHFIDANGTINRHRSLSKVLTTFDRSTLRLRQVALDPDDTLPICKLTTIDAIRAELRAKEKPKRGLADSTKQVELNWAADPNDVEHRVRKLQEFLREGRRVEVLLAPKPKKQGRRASPEEIVELLRTLRDAVREVEGAEEWKEMDGVVGTQCVLYLRPRGEGLKRGASMEEKAERLAKKEVDKEERRLKQEKRMARVKEDRREQQRLVEELQNAPSPSPSPL